MIELVNRALLIPYFPAIFISSTSFITLLGFLYGFSMSFVKGTRKALFFGFFVIVVATIMILISSSSFIFFNKCANDSIVYSCDLDGISKVTFSLILVTVHLFINIILGHVGLFLGVGFYFPGELYLRKFKFISNLKKDSEELTQLTLDSKTMTTGNFKLPESNQGINLTRHKA